MPGPRRTAALSRACHPGPALAVTVLATAYAVSAGLGPSRVGLVAAAVLAGQLSIGWGNDLVDASRDQAVGRGDKPVATGDLPRSTARVAVAVASAATVVLSLACGVVAGLVHLGCVAAGWAYNLGVKATPLSGVPFAVAFGGLPVFVALAEPGGGPPPWWVVVAGALLGVGAHLVNVLPDLADDEATGVRGLAHRVGPRQASVLAVASLGAATGVIAVGASAVPGVVLVLVLATVAVLAGLALVAGGRVPFRAAVGIALVDVVLLVVAR
ncbi:MAG TPA: UbiA family prenyltransferase [Nocardioidaceae bacterium]|nr:UbiA family prenyltransferase [Nocardioidaceae bacterium]